MKLQLTLLVYYKKKKNYSCSKYLKCKKCKCVHRIIFKINTTLIGT